MAKKSRTITLFGKNILDIYWKNNKYWHPIGITYMHGFYFSEQPYLVFNLNKVELWFFLPWRVGFSKDSCEWKSYGVELTQTDGEFYNQLLIRKGLKYKFFFLWNYPTFEYSSIYLSIGTWVHDYARPLTHPKPNSWKKLLIDIFLPHIKKEYEKKQMLFKLFNCNEKFELRELDPSPMFSKEFLVQDLDGTFLTVKCTFEKRSWKRKIFYYLPVKSYVRTSMDMQFDKEVGKGKGSWKGGCTGTGVTINEEDINNDIVLLQKIDETIKRLNK